MHDHWLALVAMSLGDVAYVSRPLLWLCPALWGRAWPRAAAAPAAGGHRPACDRCAIVRDFAA